MMEGGIRAAGRVKSHPAPGDGDRQLVRFNTNRRGSKNCFAAGGNSCAVASGDEAVTSGASFKDEGGRHLLHEKGPRQRRSAGTRSVGFLLTHIHDSRGGIIIFGAPHNPFQRALDQFPGCLTALLMSF